MPIYTVRKLYRYSELVEDVEAADEDEAKDKAMHMEGDRVYDDSLWDCEIEDERESDDDQAD